MRRMSSSLHFFMASPTSEGVALYACRPLGPCGRSSIVFFGPQLIEDSRNILFVSAATVWEISTKRTVSPEKMPISGGEAVRFFQRAGYKFLDIFSDHALKVETLPRHHNDPFDRLIVAQALIEPLVLVTSDRILSLYSDSFIIVP